MARNFRRQRHAHPIADLNVTNLIDLGFILLVVFMIATPLLQQEQTIQVNLPTVAKMPETKVDKNDRHVPVGVDASGNFYVETKVVSLAELKSKLRAFAAEPKPPVMRIRGDARIPYQKVAELVAEIQRAGLTKFNFDDQIEK